MPTLEELSTNFATAKQSVLFKGKPGSGKTAAALSFPGPILYLYSDPNTATVAEIAESRGDIVGVQITSWNQFDTEIRPILRDRSVLRKYTTVVLDSWSFLTSMIQRDLETQSKMDQQSWGRLLNRSLECMLEIITLTAPASYKDKDGNTQRHEGCHVVVTCHTKEVFSEGARPNDPPILQSVDLDIQGGFRSKLAAYFSYVLLLEAKEGNFTVHTVAPFRHTECKGGRLPAKLEIPAEGTVFQELNKTWEI